MKKKLNRYTDLAAGFFTGYELENNDRTNDTKSEPVKKLGGRPKKDGLKNIQFTLTMDPIIYEKLKILARNYYGGNFSKLIDNAVKSYCRENQINLNDINLDPEIIKVYQEKQNKKKKQNNK